MKKLQIIFVTLLAALSTAVFTACGEDPGQQTPSDVSIDVSAREFPEVGSDGGELTFEITSNGGWTITGMPEWIDVSPFRGSGDKTVTIEVAINDSGAIRTATLAVTSDSGVVRKIAIVQLAVSVKPTIIPDPGFRAMLENRGYVKVLNADTGLVEITEAGKKEKSMTVSHPSSTNLVQSLEGLEFFTEIEFLDARFLGTIYTMDVSANTKLKTIYTTGNPLTALDVSTLPDLEVLQVASCAIEELDVSKNPRLKSLNINGNPIVELDVTKNPELTELFCTTCCRYTAGGDSNSTVVASISRLDLSGCPKLTYLHCGWNPFLTELDLSTLPKLQVLHTYGIGATRLDTSHNPELENFQPFFSPSLATVDVSGNPKLKWFYLDETAVTSVDLSQNPNLAEFRFCDTQIESIDLSHNPELLTLYCYGSAIKSLNVSGNPKLIELDVASTGLTALDVSNNPDLQMLNCLSTKITSLDLSGCPEMRRFGWTVSDESIVCDYLNITGCRNLTLLQILTKNHNALQAGDNTIYLGVDTEEEGLLTAKIKTIIADNVATENFYCEKNPYLETLSIQNNRLARVELFDNTRLGKLYMNGTDAAGQPTTIDQSGNAADFKVIDTPRP